MTLETRDLEMKETKWRQNLKQGVRNTVDLSIPVILLCVVGETAVFLRVSGFHFDD